MDIEKEISIKIEGELGKNNSLSVDALVALSQKLQELIQAVAKATCEDDTSIDMENFKIELCGFRAGSAVPTFRLSEAKQGLIGTSVAEQRKRVSAKMSVVFSASQSGNFAALKDEFPSDEGRNEILQGFYDFSKTVGDSPMSIVDKNDNREYQIHRLPKKALEKFLTPTEPPKKEEKKEEKVKCKSSNKFELLT